MLLLQAAQRAPADPMLVRLILACGGTPPEGRLAHWSSWPALLALSWWAPVWAAAAYLPAEDALANCMDCMALCGPALALAVAEAAASPVLPDDLQVRGCSNHIAQRVHGNDDAQLFATSTPAERVCEAHCKLLKRKDFLNWKEATSYSCEAAVV